MPARSIPHIQHDHHCHRPQGRYRGHCRRFADDVRRNAACGRTRSYVRQDRPLQGHLHRTLRLRRSSARVREPARQARQTRLQQSCRHLRDVSHAASDPEGAALLESEGRGRRSLRVDAGPGADRQRPRDFRRLFDARSLRVHAVLGGRDRSRVRAGRDERALFAAQDRRGGRAGRRRSGHVVRQEFRTAAHRVHAAAGLMAQQSTSSDALTRFVFDAAPVRGALVTLERTTREILTCHTYPPALSRALGELCAASPLIGSTLKLDGSLIVQLASAGPVRLAVVECNDALDIRATAQWNDAATAALRSDATLAALAGGTHQGRLTITLDPRGGGSMYQGIVALEATTIARLIEHYLATS